MTRIYHLNRTREIIDSYGLDFKKSLGQNFLIDGNVLKKIGDTAGVNEESKILEVGPGIGSLTEELLIRGAEVHSIEIDQRFFPILEENLEAYPKFKLYQGDATNEELFSKAAQGMTDFVANLPYVVTTPILENIFTLGKFKSATVMVQREVAARMTAEVGSKDYSALSVFVKYFSDAREAFVVKPGGFIPRPKVDSAVVYMKLKENKDHKSFMKLVHAAFGMRRKTILNSISMGLGADKKLIEDALVDVNIDPGKRAENLGLEDYIKLEDRLKDIL